MIREADYYGDALVGLFLGTNNKVTLIPNNTPLELENTIKQVLGTKTIKASIYNSSLIGLFSTLNSDTLLVPEIIYSEERSRFEEHFDNVVEIPQYTAVGNLISINDTHAIVSPVLPKVVDKILSSDCGLEVLRTRIAGIDVVGSLIVLTNEGFVLSSLANKSDLESVRKFTGLDGVTTTINYGNPMVGSGIVANSRGALVGMETTPFEMGKVDEALFLR